MLTKNPTKWNDWWWPNEGSMQEGMEGCRKKGKNLRERERESSWEKLGENKNNENW